MQTHAAQDGQAFPCYYINLKRRPDRRIQMEQELYHAGLKCERVEAVDALERGILGAEACRQSHRSALDRLKMSGKPYGLIFEDDATFFDVAVAQPILRQLPAAMRNHPVVVLACNMQRYESGSPESGSPADELSWLQAIGRTTSCLTTSAYFVRTDYVNALESQAYNLEIKKLHIGGDIDQRWQKLQNPDRWAMTHPLLIKQRATFSDIENKMVDYGAFHAKLATMHKPVALLARQQDPVAQQLITAANAHAEASLAIKEAAAALKDTALSLKTTVAQVAEASGEEDKLKKAVKAHIDQSNEELEKLEKSLGPAKILREIVEAQGPPTTPAPAAPVQLSPPAAATVGLASPAPAAPLPPLVMPAAPAAAAVEANAGGPSPAAAA